MCTTRMVGVCIARRDGCDVEFARELTQHCVATCVAVGIRALKLDVEALRPEHARQLRGPQGGPPQLAEAAE